ncbi:MAG: tetratricopeptide repeat protein, partial [Geminicoccaceae bacterium]
YVGSEACVGCHEAAGRAWRHSHHALAWTLPDETTVLGDFDEAVFEHKGVNTHFSRDGNDGFFVEIEEVDGSQRRFEIEAVVGIAPLQQYLVATEEGRLQALDVAWDAVQERWYHLYPDQELRPGDGLHWTGPYKSWNARCAECHATGFVKNYDPRARRYASEQAEIGVGCEACHGPGEAHLAWTKEQKAEAASWHGLTEKGFTIGFTLISAEAEIQQCAGCHARREPLTDGNPLPGTSFHDAYRLALLREGTYHPDGSIQDEVYVYGSFLQSKMSANGVRCSDCHDPHGAELKAEGDAICTQCHSAAGNPRFPSLRQATYDDPSHHFHEVGSEGAACRNCHMIERVYMGTDGRRDHSFRVPRPDLSEETGAPNACTDCHGERDASWAAAEIASRYPGSARRGQHFSQTFAAARKGSASVKDLLEIAEDQESPGIVRATALDLLRPVADPMVAERTEPMLGDDDPLVRSAAVALQRAAPMSERIQRLVTVMDDPMQSVRIAAAREFLDAKIAHLPDRTAEKVREAMGGWQASLLAKTDFPETHMALGGAALVQRNAPAAEHAFREAVHLDPQAVEAWTMLARILAATGDPDSAAAALDAALEANPKDGRLRSLRDDLRDATKQ